MKNISSVVSVIIGTLIGAGFASGKEIEIFFCKYGIYGVGGIILSSILIGILVYFVFFISDKFKIETYDQFLDFILEKNFMLKTETKRTQLIICIIKNIINLFLLISFFIMVAGFGSYFYQEFLVEPIWGAFVLALLCYLTFRKGIRGITKISSILIPVLIGVIIILGMKQGISFPVEQTNFPHMPGEWMISAILYGSYNTILLIPILFPLKKYVISLKMNKKISVISIFIIILLATIIYSITIGNYIEITQVEMPMIYIIGKNNVVYKYLYSILILVSIYTSAISARIFFSTKCSRKELSKRSNDHNLYIICHDFQSWIFIIGKCNISYFRNIGINTNLSNIKMPEKYLKKKPKTDIT